MLLLQRPEEIQPRLAPQAEVDEGHVTHPPLRRADRRRPVTGLHDGVPVGLKGDPQGAPDVGLIVDHQDVHRKFAPVVCGEPSRSPHGSSVLISYSNRSGMSPHG